MKLIKPEPVKTVTIKEDSITGGYYTLPIWYYDNGKKMYQLKPDAIGNGLDRWIVTPIFRHERPTESSQCRHTFQSKKSAIRYIKSHLIPLDELAGE